MTVKIVRGGAMTGAVRGRRPTFSTARMPSVPYTNDHKAYLEFKGRNPAKMVPSSSRAGYYSPVDGIPGFETQIRSSSGKPITWKHHAGQVARANQDRQDLSSILSYGLGKFGKKWGKR